MTEWCSKCQKQVNANQTKAAKEERTYCIECGQLLFTKEYPAQGIKLGRNSEGEE